jgi:hypothetical protein
VRGSGCKVQPFAHNDMAPWRNSRPNPNPNPNPNP